MVKNISLFVILTGILTINSCKKESGCTDLSAYYQNKYIMRDSIVYPHDSIVIIPDTIAFNPIPNSGGKCFINFIPPEGNALLVDGCANNFKVDTGGEGLYIFYGNGSITNNGGNINLIFQRVPVPYFPSDTLRYYCSGTKQ